LTIVYRGSAGYPMVDVLLEQHTQNLVGGMGGWMDDL